MNKLKFLIIATVIELISLKWQLNSDIWYTDSGALDYFLFYKELFKTFCKLSKSIIIKIVEGIAIGTIIVIGKNDIKIELQLNNVIYTPNISLNLFSLIVVYNLRYKTRITLEYKIKIFHKDTLVA